ncbi:hypothetical protein TPHA_0D02660 [Tetrapisispora phaffii CBS 4417]|uniref:Nucleoporin NDC1 n=1 Tax=Tetrapisispora phaffii (strain ATCC 24235 / CBS 4417 / NBRC 1672 / NRRL Y-8282 / UCD 70-5) TaxID=1071381 RepID=G8BST2_TETPH|nr:hypothetical protein TPHA_0D02660 [Tetrapisispora phaffii CBS 4417]CCE62903.1 hypothetical protein TPHA_0D02660 [Tetrapisispora phaffii CBS 4417]
MNGSILSYRLIFNDVSKTRFHNLATRLLIISSCIEALFWSLVTSNNNQLLIWIPKFFLKLVLSYIINICIITTRKQYLYVQSRDHSNIAVALIKEMFTVRCIIYEFIYIISCMLISLVMKDTIGPAFLDYDFLNYFQIYIWFIIPSTYTFQHMCLNVDKLSFLFGYSIQDPQDYIVGRFHKIVIKSAILGLSCNFISLIIFFSFTDLSIVNFKFQGYLIILSFYIFMKFEFANLTFSAYMSIGCLYKGKPISLLSRTPIETLLSGLLSGHEFTKLTAFQELLYRSTLSSPHYRYPIYDLAIDNPIIWNQLLESCLVIIQATNEPVESYIHAVRNNYIPFHKYREPKNNITTGSYYKVSTKNQSMMNNGFNEKYLRNESTNDNSYTLLPDLVNILYQSLASKIWYFFFPSIYNKPENSYKLTLFEAWTMSKSRQANRLVKSPILHANSVIALTGLLINAKEEDGFGRVKQSIGSVLTCLEKSMYSLGKFNDLEIPSHQIVPFAKKIANANEEATPSSPAPDIISILYDLSVSAFLELVLKYDTVLDDVYLDTEVRRLSEWILNIYRN